MHEQSKGLDKARTDYNAYLRHVWPEHIPFTEGRHLRRLGDIFNDIIAGKKKRVIINVGPRHSKSQNASIFFPAFYLGKFPYRQIIQASNVSDLAVGFGRQVRDLIREPAYQELFPGLQIKADSSAAGRWDTNKGGRYYAVGAEGNITGRGGHLVIVDDPHSDEQIKLGNTNPAIYDSTFNWYVGTLRQRLMPGGSILVVQSRFHKRDLTGRILEHAKQNGTLDEWEIFEFPAIMPSGKPLWPEFWSIEELDSLKRDMPPSRWNSQYLQQPSDAEGAIVKKESWRAWDQKLPDFEFKIQSWDTAFSAKDTANYSACTTWGVFKHNNSRDGKPELHAMLIHAYRERMEFTRLKKLAKEFYIDHRPDSIIVEEKATGRPLIFELQQMNIPVSSYTPTKGNDKVVRVNSVSDLFSSGKIWYVPNNQTETVIDEFTDFPSGAYDDFVDSGTQALMRFRQGLFIHTDNDETDDEDDFEYNNRSYGYY